MDSEHSKGSLYSCAIVSITVAKKHVTSNANEEDSSEIRRHLDQSYIMYGSDSIVDEETP